MLLLIEAVCMLPVIVMLSGVALVASILWFVAMCGGSRAGKPKHPGSTVHPITAAALLSETDSSSLLQREGQRLRHS